MADIEGPRIVRRYFEFRADVERAERSTTKMRSWSFHSQASGLRASHVHRVAPAVSRRRAEVRFRLRRVTARVDLAVVELTASYDGESWLQGVQLLEFRGDKVARERIYVTEAWEAPEWRARWRADTPADPPEEIIPN